MALSLDPTVASSPSNSSEYHTLLNPILEVMLPALLIIVVDFAHGSIAFELRMKINIRSCTAVSYLTGELPWEEAFRVPLLFNCINLSLIFLPRNLTSKL